MTMPSDAETKAAIEVQRPPTPLMKVDALPSFESIVQSVAGGQLTADGVATLMEVYLKRQDQLAEQAYNAAFAAFQQQCPKIPRTSKVKISNAGIAYSYASVETIMDTIGPVLAANGLSVSFEGTKVEGNMLTATCRCSHVGGHSRVSSFAVTTDSKAGMSPQQKYGAAATYAQRRALSGRLGLWTGDPDHDGGEPPAPSPLLTEQQRQHIERLVNEAGAEWSKVLGWWKVANLNEACQDKYEAAVRSLEWQKKQRQTKGLA
jgi:hypothetical protein